MTHRVTSVVAGAILSGLGAACATPPPRAPVQTCPPAKVETSATRLRGAAGVVHGSVQDRDTGRPLQNATVYFPSSTRIVSTDSAGTFAFTGLASGTYTMRTRYIGYLERVDTLTLHDGDGVEARLALVPDYIHRCWW